MIGIPNQVPSSTVLTNNNAITFTRISKATGNKKFHKCGHLNLLNSFLY